MALDRLRLAAPYPLITVIYLHVCVIYFTDLCDKKYSPDMFHPTTNCFAYTLCEEGRPKKRERKLPEVVSFS